ncbi:MAG: PAS domain S-box protein, partial [Cytophagales bacterium]
MIDLLETTRLKDEIEANPVDYAKIIENTDLAICITDKFGNFFAVNDNYCKVYGYARTELIGNSFLMVVPEESKKELENLHDKFIEIQIEIFRTWEVVNKQGRKMSISVDAGYTDKING